MYPPPHQETKEPTTYLRLNNKRLFPLFLHTKLKCIRLNVFKNKEERDTRNCFFVITDYRFVAEMSGS